MPPSTSLKRVLITTVTLNAAVREPIVASELWDLHQRGFHRYAPVPQVRVASQWRHSETVILSPSCSWVVSKSWVVSTIPDKWCRCYAQSRNPASIRHRYRDMTDRRQARLPAVAFRCSALSLTCMSSAWFVSSDLSVSRPMNVLSIKNKNKRW